jgi:hypothetical protein
MSNQKKRIWYSTPLKFYWDVIYKTQKKITPYFSDEKIYEVLKTQQLRSPLVQGETIDKRGLFLSGLDLWGLDIKGELLHIFFLDRSLRDFLETTTLSDLDGLREFLYQNGIENNFTYFTTKQESKSVDYSFGLHIPYEKKGYAFQLSLFEDSTVELFFSHGQNSGRMSDKFYSELLTKKDPKSMELVKQFRLAINTIAYMKCFPECVSEGVPEVSNKHKNLHSKINLSLGLSENVIDTDKSPISKIPHFRRGHFRVLKSDFYKNKKGEVIYIAETMVKGRAKTVSKSDQIQELKDRSSQN